MKKILFLLCLFPSLLVGCASNDLTCNLEVEEVPDIFEFHTEKQLEYLTSNSLDTLPSGVEGTIDQSRPKPLTFKFKATGKGVPKDFQYVLKISESSTLKNPLIYSTIEESIDVTNLKIDTTYYYQVSVVSNGKSKNSEIYSFTTADTFIRNIDINGVANSRDIGGFVASDGVRSQQGLIYRTGRLNVSASRDEIYPKPLQEVYYDITDDGIYTLRNELNIRSEIDVRLTKDNETGFITESPLGEDVNYYNIPMEWDISSTQNILDYNKARVVEFFEVLGDEDNYPMIFHCDIGTDRTGMFSILMHGLLGDDIDEIHKDYLFSNFGMIKDTRKWTKTDGYRKKLETAEGDDFAEKTRNYLVKTIGVDEDDIDNFVSIMKDGIKVEPNRDNNIKIINRNRKLNVGDSAILSYVFESTKDNIDSFKIDFTSSKPDILSVDEKGNLTALKEGEAVIKLENKSLRTSKEIKYKVINPENCKKYEYVFEGEEATLGGSSSKPTVKTKYEGDETYGTDGICISCADEVNGQYLEFNINSTQEQEVSIAFRMAVYSRAKAFYNKCIKSIVVNGETITMDDTEIEVDDELMYGIIPWYNWSFIYVDDVSLLEGENVIRVNIANSPKTNFDLMKIDAEFEIF